MRRDENAVSLTAAQSEAADAGLKCMIPVGRPFLDYVLNALVDGGIRDVCIIVAGGDQRIRARYTRDVVPSRVNITFAEQASPAGTANAILAARAFAGNDDFIVANGDNLYTSRAIAAIGALNGNAIAAYPAASLVARGNIPRERLRAFAVIEPDDRGNLRRVIEKPGEDMRIGDDTLISMNLWAFTPAIFSACERVESSERGELELAGAVRIALRDGAEFRIVPIDDGVLDLTERRDIAAVTARLRNVAVTI
jgi:glucose-1-phosphate thymidylyltransferase